MSAGHCSLNDGHIGKSSWVTNAVHDCLRLKSLTIVDCQYRLSDMFDKQSKLP
jgi:hypothetical protein